GRDVGQRDQHQAPVVLVPLEDRQLQVYVQEIAFQGVILDFSLVKEPVMPQVDQLFGEGGAGFLAEDVVHPLDQLVPGFRLEQRQGVVIDVDDADFLEAAVDE